MQRSRDIVVVDGLLGIVLVLVLPLAAGMAVGRILTMLQHSVQEARHLEVLSVLTVTSQVTPAAQLEVDLREVEATLIGDNGLEALERLRILGIREEKAPRLFRSSSHPATELMQLRQAEAVSTLDHHHGRVGNVDADFDHRGGDEDGHIATVESGHHGFLLGRFQPPME